VEVGVRDGDVRHVGERRLRAPERAQRRQVVERRHLDALLDVVDQRVVDERRLHGEIAEVHDPVTHRVGRDEVVDGLGGVVLADERQLEARRAGVDDEDAARPAGAAQWGQVQSWTSG
jgi:hypothetical protein